MQARFLEFKIQNMVGSCDVKFPIRLEGLVINQPQFSRYLCTTVPPGTTPLSLYLSSSYCTDIYQSYDHRWIYVYRVLPRMMLVVVKNILGRS